MSNWMRTKCEHLCRNGRAAAGRTIMWTVFVMTAAGLFGSIHRESSIREEQLCGVVINIHNNAQFRAHDEQQRLKATLDFINDKQAKENEPTLWLLAKKNLPDLRDRVAAVNFNVEATRVPPVCQKYRD